MDQATDTPPVAEAPSQSAPENAASLTSAENEERPRPTKPSALRGEGARAGGGQGRRPKACRLRVDRDRACAAAELPTQASSARSLRSDVKSFPAIENVDIV